jgi:hypothetical protein
VILEQYQKGRVVSGAAPRPGGRREVVERLRDDEIAVLDFIRESMCD